MSRVLEKREDGSLVVRFDGWSDKFNMVGTSNFRKYHYILPELSPSDLSPQATLAIQSWRGGSGFLWTLKS